MAKDKNYNPESVRQAIKTLKSHLDDTEKGQQFIKDVKYAIYLLENYKKENE